MSRSEAEKGTVKPPRLRPGDLVGVLAPSGPVSVRRVEEGLAVLERRGFRIVQAPHLGGRRGYLAGGDTERLTDLVDFLANPRIKMILCARGGYGCLRLLDRLPYAEIRRRPKILVGFSDVTALLLGVHARSGLVTFHGPMAGHMGREGQENTESLLRLISAQEPYELAFGPGGVLRAGRARGPLVGGNLSLLCHLLGTPYMPSMENRILFLEDVNEPLYRVDRMLTHLRLAGVFDRLRGLALGDFEGCGKPGEVVVLVEQMLGPRSYPVVSGLPVGHGARNLALPIGTVAELDASQHRLTVCEPVVA